MKTNTSGLLLLALLSGCTQYDGSDVEVAKSAITAVAAPVEETASCPDGETLVSSAATCKFSLKGANATGPGYAYSLLDGQCTCYVKADCEFNDKSSVCAGGTLSEDEDYPCNTELTGNGKAYVTSFAKGTYQPASLEGCKTACGAVYDRLDQALKNKFAIDACTPNVPAEYTKKPISCCMPG